MINILKRVLVGRPIATAEQEHQRISKKVALAVFSSDAISSTAYATQEILHVVAIGTVATASSLDKGLSTLVPIAIAVCLLLAIVVTSYRQTIFTYPSGGGSYVVSRENLGKLPSLIAGASLLVDYVLTVAVSIAAGVQAIISIPQLREFGDHIVLLSIALILILTLANLRGVKESGRIFSAPTYIYIGILAAMLCIGLYGEFFGHIDKIPFDAEKFEGTHTGAGEFGGQLTLLLILKGFSSGAVALTGVEAISNGVPAFKRSESRNAATTMVFMGTILGSLFLGVSILASYLRPFPREDNVSVLSQMGDAVFNSYGAAGDVAFYILQFSTATMPD